MALFNRAFGLLFESRREDGAVSRMWGYSTPDAVATLTAAGYFNGQRDRLGVGDTILASAGIGGTPATVILRVAAVPGTGNVTVATVLNA